MLKMLVYVNLMWVSNQIVVIMLYTYLYSLGANLVYLALRNVVIISEASA